jgi:DNA-binding XRE family transcriptional regulator
MTTQVVEPEGVSGVVPRRFLRELRKHLDMTQDEMAAAVGCHGKHWGHVERGLHPCSKRMTRRLRARFRSQLEELGISVEDLLDL